MANYHHMMANRLHKVLFGIVSDRSVPEVAEELGTFRRALATLGFSHTSPIMALGVLTLPVSPELKLTDLGLVDVTRGVIVPLIVED